MNRLTVVALAVVVVGASIALSTSARSQLGAPKSSVALQPTTPGISQSGHANISGTMRAAEHVGGGSGLTGVNADKLDNLDSTAFLQSVPNPLFLSGASASPIISCFNSETTGAAYAMIGNSAAASGTGVRGTCTGATGIGVTGVGNTALFGLATGASGQGIFATGDFLGGRFVGNTVGANGVEGFGGVNAYGVSAIGGSGVYGQANSVGGYAGNFLGRTYVNGSSGVNVVPGTAALSVAGNGIDAVLFYNNGAGRGLQVNAVSDTAIWAISQTGIAGVDGRTGSASGYGVFGTNTNATGSGIGVAGFASGANMYGVYAFGRSGASGTKSFRIDHPQDPEGKYLLHYSAEGPQPLNVYVGSIVTDASGWATVELPSYFESINKDPLVQLTVNDTSDDFVRVKQVGDVRNGVFRIRTDKPNVKVNWRVDAERNDRWMQRYGAPVEMDKPAALQGTYQHPELYNQPMTKSETYFVPKQGEAPKFTKAGK